MGSRVPAPPSAQLLLDSGARCSVSLPKERSTQGAAERDYSLRARVAGRALNPEWCSPAACLGCVSRRASLGETDHPFVRGPENKHGAQVTETMRVEERIRRLCSGP
ncbi:hypothetical protein MTO96_027702 [Rhipicephalus appendiculatus]